MSTVCIVDRGKEGRKEEDRGVVIVAIATQGQNGETARYMVRYDEPERRTHGGLCSHLRSIQQSTTHQNTTNQMKSIQALAITATDSKGSP